MLEETLKNYFKENNRALHVWRIKKDSSLVPVATGNDQSALLDSKHSYLLARFFKTENFDAAPTVSKLKLFVWIGCQCAYSRSLFSPIVQCCRNFSQVVELLAEFQFNESPDLLFWLNTCLNPGAEVPRVHPIIRYSFTGHKDPPKNYFLIINTVGSSGELRHFSAITQVPVCTQSIFPECTYVNVAQTGDKAAVRVLTGSEAPEIHALIVGWITAQLKTQAANLEVTSCKEGEASEEWKQDFAHGGYDYLIENFFVEDEEGAVRQHKDFADQTVDRIAEAEKAEGEAKGTMECFRIYFESYKASIRGALEEEMRKLKLGSHTVNKTMHGWKLHFKPMQVKSGKYLDGNEMIVFSKDKYVLLWMGSNVPLWISCHALAIVTEYLRTVARGELNVRPYFLLDDPTESRHFVFLFQGKESHRFKSLFPLWPVPQPAYYRIAKKKAPRMGFATEKGRFRAKDDAIKAAADMETVLYWRCIKKSLVKEKAEPMRNISGFPYNVIYGFKRKERRIQMPVCDSPAKSGYVDLHEPC